MKIIIALHHDSMNLFVENVVRSLEKYHQVKIFAFYTDEQSLRMFADLKTPIAPIAECTDEVIAWADCIFSTIGALWHFDRAHKYIFMFCNILPIIEEVRGADFVFLVGPAPKETIPYFASMPVGLPKNDVVKANGATKEKQILFVDSGHYPFGRKGKVQIAKMLVSICNAHPDYRVCVKPRWFPGATGVEMTHQNFDHIYTVLAEMYPTGLPQNLDLLQEHKNLQTLIDESACVLTLATTAHLDVVLRGKPLLVLKGFANEDTYMFNKSYFEGFCRSADESGCVIHFKDVLQHLPHGIVCKPKYIKKAISYETGTSDRVVEVMEYVFANFLSKGKFPDLKQYDYTHYKKQLSAKAGLTYEDLIANRFFVLAKNAGMPHRRLQGKFNLKSFDRELHRMCEKAVRTEQSADDFKKEVILYKAQYFLQRFHLLTNEMDRARLYTSLCACRMYDEILAIEAQQLGSREKPESRAEKVSRFFKRLLGRPSPSSPGAFGRNGVDAALNYSLATIYYAKGQLPKSKLYFDRYFKGVFSRSYPKYNEEKETDLKRGFATMFKILLNKKQPKELNRYVRKYLRFNRPGTLIGRQPNPILIICLGK